jgi:hypothetical protein
MVMVTFFWATEILSKVTEMNLMGISMSEEVIKMLLLEILTGSREIQTLVLAISMMRLVIKISSEAITTLSIRVITML